MDDKEFEYLTPLQTDYRLITNHWITDEVQQIEKSLFLSETFSFNRNFFTFPFRKSFDHYQFLENHRFFRQEDHYQSLTRFLKAINSSSFFLSAPAYASLYPIEISVNCPFSVYKDAPAYVLEETMDVGRRPLQHPMYGVGFVIMPHVFVYDRSRQWAMLLSDNVTDLATIGLTTNVKNAFMEAFELWPSLSASEAITRRTWRVISVEEREKFRLEYES